MAIVGLDRVDDEERRLQEYSPGFAPEVFAAHERSAPDDPGRRPPVP